MPNPETDTLLALNQRLLDTIAQADWLAYASLCDPSLTCFETEAEGQLVEGLKFHKYYFDLGKSSTPINNTIASPHVRIMGGVAVVSYTRLTQRLNANGSPETKAVNETRIWQKQGEHWKHVHFHRSVP